MKFKPVVIVGTTLTVVGILAGCGQSRNSTTENNTVVNKASTSTPATNSSVTTNTGTNNTTGNSVAAKRSQQTNLVKMKVFSVGNRFSVDIPTNAERTGPYPTNSDAFFWTYKNCKISVDTNYNPLHQTLKSTLKDYSKGLVVTSTSQGKDWFQEIGTLQKQGVSRKLVSKTFVGQMIQTVTISYPESQLSQYGALAQNIISSFQVKTV